ncbi:MAG: hypothetical protein MAG453_01690 [Calditrichaeota bacterium]|nr:hypothetical protein [Calditrichota bacterium]
MSINSVRKLMLIALIGCAGTAAAVAVFDREAGLLQVLRMKQRHHELSTEARALEARKQFLIERLARLEAGDQQTIEAVARDKNMIRPGDIVYRVHFRPPSETKAAR